MKNHQNCGFWTKVLIYTLVVTINMLYMPLAGLSIVSASKGKPSVYVLGFSGDGSTPERLIAQADEIFEDGLKKESKINYISDKDVKKLLKASKPATPTTGGVKGDPEKYKKAQKYLKRAKKYFSDEKMDKVAKYAGRAVKYFKANADLVEDFNDVRDAYLYLAAGLAEQDKDATEALLNVLAFDPGFKLPSDMEETLEEVFEEAQDAKKRAQLTIEADPEDADIIVNGRKKSSPAEFSKLPAGDYFIRVQQGNMKPFTKVMSLSQKQDEKMTIVLEGERKSSGGDKNAVLKKLEKKLAKQDFDNSFFNDLQKLGEWISADYILLGGYKSTNSKSKIYPLIFTVQNAKMAQIKARSVSHKDSAKAEKSIKKQYRRAEKAILGDYPTTVLSPGFVLGEDDEEDAPAVAAAPVPAPEPEPVYESEPVPETLNLDVDASILLSSDDASKAIEDSESEESIAPIERTPIHKKWWFWTIIGVVVVGGGVTAGILLKPDNNSDTSKLVIPKN